MSEHTPKYAGLIAHDLEPRPGVPAHVAIALSPAPKAPIFIDADIIKPSTVPTSEDDTFPGAWEKYRIENTKYRSAVLLVYAIRDAETFPVIAQSIREQLPDYRILESPKTSARKLVDSIFLGRINKRPTESW
jgi:hypothetical protein